NHTIEFLQKLSWRLQRVERIVDARLERYHHPPDKLQHLVIRSSRNIASGRDRDVFGDRLVQLQIPLGERDCLVAQSLPCALQLAGTDERRTNRDEPREAFVT